MKGALKYGKIALLFSLAIGVVFAFTGYPTNAAEPKAKAPATTPKKGDAAPQKIDPTDPASIIYLDTSGKPAGVGDPNKPAGTAYKAGRGWHPQALAATGLPKDRYGLIDWAKIVRSNLVKPRHSLNPDDEEMPPLQMDVLIPAKGDFVDDVIYPHEMHTYWLKCEVCHPKIFIPARGQNNMTMVAIGQGEFCGRCHGKVAFPLSDCKRCHTSPKSATK